MQKDWYSQLRYDVWRLAQAGIFGTEWAVDALEDIVRAVEDSDNDADWERRQGCRGWCVVASDTPPPPCRGSGGWCAEF
jgi:hypothetical protein